MKLIFGLAAISGVIAGKGPMNELDKKFKTAADFLVAFQEEHPKIMKKDRTAQFAKAKSNLMRLWNR